MTFRTKQRSSRRRAAGLAASLALMLATAAIAAACGGSSSAATTGGSATTTTGRSVQVLATVRLGNLVESAAGRVKLPSAKTKVDVKLAVQVAGQTASQVAAGQSATVTFIKLPAGAGRLFGSGSPHPYAGASGAPSGSQGYSGQGTGAGGQGFFGRGAAAFGGKTAQGTVTAVSAGSNGTVTATVTIAKLPSGVTSKYMGIAQIQVKVLASNVLIIPTAAIKGSGSSATVQLLAGSKTTTQSVVVGQQAGGESEITSGLSAGQSVIYMRTFTGRFGGGFRSGYSGGQGGTTFGGQSSGSTTSGT